MIHLKKIGFYSAFILPTLLIGGFYLGGKNMLSIHVFTFMLVPLLDFMVSLDKANVPANQISAVSQDRFYRLVTYVWVYIQLITIFWGFYIVTHYSLSISEWIALTTGMALVTGGVGITVAHELGHKNTRWEKFYAKVLLMTVCYMHFIIEHNRGHHVRVATPHDPATSRYGENFYKFWLRSVTEGYISAWKLERDRLRSKNIPLLSLSNQMLQFTFLPLAFAGMATLGFSLYAGRPVWEVPLLFFAQSFLAFSLLEIVNYLEHYGMERKFLPNGRYEKVTPYHSWNASHTISNFLLFQLQRHSDHHAFAYKRYQVLDHNENSPQLPAGYSAMIILALLPPLWFKVMNPRLYHWKKQLQNN